VGNDKISVNAAAQIQFRGNFGPTSFVEITDANGFYRSAAVGRAGDSIPNPFRFVTIVMIVALAGMTAHTQIGPSRKGDVTLALECRDAAHLGFEIRNVGATDTTLRLGIVLGNGSKYMIDGLDLILKMLDGQPTEFGYSPRHYPAAVGGSLAQWLEPLPTRAAYSMSAIPDDFFNGVRRLDSFPAGTELSLRWTIRDPPPQAMLLAYWSGTLTSNSCMPIKR
jgi:hypothetical protein